MAKFLRLIVLTPEKRLLFVEGVSWIQAQLVDGGGIGIYPGHAPLLAETITYPLKYKDASGVHTIDLESGILHIDHTDVTIFTDESSSTRKPEKPFNDENKQFIRLARELLSTPITKTGREIVN